MDIFVLMNGAHMKKLVVLSGSGISAESGISTFRGGNGLWDNEKVEDVCTPEGWRRDPARVLDFYNKRREQLRTSEPNEAHLILAGLELGFDVCVVTQNVDDLHERAGSSHIIHLHGELTKIRPEDSYGDWDGYSTKYVQDIGYRPVLLGEKGGCNSRQMRPHIVWFGEPVPNLQEAAVQVSTADVLLIIGTSLQVYPAASLYSFAPSACPIYVIDPAAVPVSEDLGVHHIRKVATEGMREFAKIISE